jgi:integrase
VKHADQPALASSVERLLTFFHRCMLADVNGQLCRDYAKQSSTMSMAGKDLTNLRAAINHHRNEGLHDQIIAVWVPPANPPRDKWLTRKQAALLLRTLWRQPGTKHIARFVYIALYTGRRVTAVCSASYDREDGRPWMDTGAGMLWPPAGRKEKKKRQPAIKLPDKVASFLRAAESRGARYVVQWGGLPVTRIDRRLREAAERVGLAGITPHVMRHTAATWMMQAGTDIWEASRYLGMTVATLERVYGHHRPEHLEGARTFHVKHRQRFANVSRVQSKNKRGQTGTKKREESKEPVEPLT